MDSSDFSSNSHNSGYRRYPLDCDRDGDFVLLAGVFYFIVDATIIELLGDGLDKSTDVLEGRPVFRLEEPADDVALFLHALHNGISAFHYDWNDFIQVSALLRFSTKYSVTELRSELISGLGVSYPTTLAQWDARDGNMTIPHPILVLQLAKDIKSPELMVSALYDLCRNLPSNIAAGVCSEGDPPAVHQLSREDLFLTLRGREAASRYLSTFIVKQLESRVMHENCPQRRRCQVSFESVTFDLIRDVNGLLCNRNSDVLFAIVDSLSLLLAQDGQGGTKYGVCRWCLEDYDADVERARNEVWASLPDWFGVEVDSWG